MIGYLIPNFFLIPPILIIFQTFTKTIVVPTMTTYPYSGAMLTVTMIAAFQEKLRLIVYIVTFKSLRKQNRGVRNYFR